jgi:para-nitrobenzyl esterase
VQDEIRGADGGAGLAFAPIVDDETIPQSLAHAVRAGVSSDTPVMVGSTAEEFDAAMRGSADDVDDARLTRRLSAMGLTNDQIEAFHRAYPGAPHEMLGQAVTQSVFRVPAIRFADARSTGPAGTWLYDFRWQSPALGGIGAAHCLDIPFAFDVLDADGVEAVIGADPPQSLADQIHGSWVRFISDGDPGPGWPRYEQARRQTKVFDTTSEVVDDPWVQLRSVWSRDTAQ